MYPAGPKNLQLAIRTNGPQQSTQPISPVLASVGLGPVDDSQSSRSKQPNLDSSTGGVPQATFAFHPGTALIAQQIPATHHQQSSQFDNSLQRHIAQMQNSMHGPIMLSAPNLQELRMHLPDATFPYFPSNLIPISRAEDFHRAGFGTPGGAGVLYPISTIFLNTENRTCCLLDRGTRCSRPAGTANFTLRIRELVNRSGALLGEDAVMCDLQAGHQYICDYHKNYIQKLRIVVPSGSHPGPSSSPTMLANHPVNHVQFAQASNFNQYSPNFVMESSIPHGTPFSRPEDLSTTSSEQDNKRINGSPGHRPTGTGSETKAKDHSEPSSNSAPVDMRKAQLQENRLSVTKHTPEIATDDSSDEELQNGPAVVDLLYGIGECFTTGDLISYMKFFDIEMPPHSARDELIRVLCEHIDGVSTGDPKAILTSFFHAVKTDTRPFNQPYKPALSVDFDLSSDEEMMVIDGKDGMMPGNTSSSDLEGVSETDGDEEMDNGEELPEIHYDEHVERALSQINGKFSVGDIERILEKYSLPSKFAVLNHDSDSDSSGPDEQRLNQGRNFHSRRRRKIRRPVLGS